MAFKENAVDPMVMTYCASKAAQEHGDARKAIDLLRIAAELAEREEREIVTLEYVSKAQNVMERDQVKSIVITLPIQHKATLASIILNQGNKNNSQQTTGEVYGTYKKLCKSYNLDELSQRRIAHIISELDMQGLINAKVVNLSMIAPETIEAAVHENNKNAAQKTPIIWSLRLIAIRALVGLARSFPPNPPPKTSPVLSVIIDGAIPGPVGKAQ